MVKLAITIVSECYQQAVDWTLGQLDGTLSIDRHALAFATRTKSMVLPMRQLVNSFYLAGYGDKATTRWINTLNDAGVITWNLMSSDRQYVSFLKCPITESDMKIILSLLEQGNQTRLPAEASA